MATFEQEQQQSQALRTVLAQLNQIEPESLIRTGDLGKELSFEKGFPVFQRTLDLFKNLSEVNFDTMPYEVLSILISLSNQVLSRLQAIQKFSATQANPAQARDQLITTLQNEWNSYYINITPIIAYSIRRGTDFDVLEREARGTASLVKQIETDVRTEKDTILAEMKGALEKVRQAAAEAGVAQHAIHFKQEAESYQKQSRAWLASAIVFGVIIVLYALWSFGPQLNDVAMSVPTGPLIQLSLSRIVIISVLSFGLIWCSRNYAASRHNLVINRHRQNALSTFETFVKASRDDKTKDAVLMQATKSIFSPQPSGYLKGETRQPQSNQIVEIVRDLTDMKE